MRLSKITGVPREQIVDTMQKLGSIPDVRRALDKVRANLNYAK